MKAAAKNKINENVSTKAEWSSESLPRTGLCQFIFTHHLKQVELIKTSCSEPGLCTWIDDELMAVLKTLKHPSQRLWDGGPNICDLNSSPMGLSIRPCKRSFRDARVA